MINDKHEEDFLSGLGWKLWNSMNRGWCGISECVENCDFTANTYWSDLTFENQRLGEESEEAEDADISDSLRWEWHLLRSRGQRSIYRGVDNCRFGRYSGRN